MANSELETLRTKLDAALAEVERLQMQSNEQSLEAEYLTKERDELIQNEHKMNAALSAKQEIIEGLKAECERLREENEYLKHELDKLRPHYANLTEERNRLREALERIANTKDPIKATETCRQIAREALKEGGLK